MIDVCEVFRNKVPNAERLIAYGFTPLDDGVFTCDFPILEGEYLARVLVADGGEVGFLGL